MTKNRYNLVDEAWIPVATRGRVSLRQVFEDSDLPALGGNPMQMIAVLKPLLAVAQAAATPRDDGEWLAMGAQGMAQKCLVYLKAHHDDFWLYGSRPFLQLEACTGAERKSYGTILPEVASGNTTLVTGFQIEPELDDAEKALALLVELCLGLGGKKADSRLVLSSGYEKKASACAGPALCYKGLLHSFLLGKNVIETVWFNMLTQEDIDSQKQWENGLGTPPWEEMPRGENDETAVKLRASLMGRLVPMARFCLLEDEGIRFTEGIVHPDYQSFMVDPSMSMDASEKKPKMLWADPEKRPWRELPALLSFLDSQDVESGFLCLGLQKGVARARKSGLESVGVWSGGVRVSSQAGEQFLSGGDDMVASEVWLACNDLSSTWFRAFSGAMGRLDKTASGLYSAVNGYWKATGMDRQNDDRARAVSGRFWQMVEPLAQDIIRDCENSGAMEALFRRCQAIASGLYDEACPHGTARQFEQWARHRPFAWRKS